MFLHPLTGVLCTQSIWLQVSQIAVSLIQATNTNVDAAEFDETTEGLGQLSLDEHQEVRSTTFDV